MATIKAAVENKGVYVNISKNFLNQQSPKKQSRVM